MTETIKLRPQPIGIFQFPASNLLLPQVANANDALQRLLLGDLNSELPEAWAFFAAAATGKLATAVELVAKSSPSPVATYNSFVLAPTPESYTAAAAALDGELLALLQVAAYTAGIVDQLDDEFPLDEELLAVALATSAATEMERENLELAKAKLKRAVAASKSSSPVLAASLLSQLADISMALPDAAPALVIQDYKEALRLAEGTALPMLIPELHMKLGMLFQNVARGQRGVLLQAVNSYQAALQNGISEEEHPQLFAQLQNNLGLAYLSMPAAGASHQLRNGIAVQSFRHALKVYTIDQYPEMWASVSMNLANALQYAPTSHPEENLIQAVETYEDVLQVRTRARDPVAYALVLLNQANALAHLGMFKPALEKLAEAYKLFHWYEQTEQANAARELVEQINQQLGDATAERVLNELDSGGPEAEISGRASEGA